MQSYKTQNVSEKVIKTAVNAEIVPLQSSDFEIASEHLSSAFSQDPLVGYFLPEDPVAKRRAFKHFSRSFLNFAQSYGHLYTTADEIKGAAIWLPPEAFKITLLQLWQVVTSGLIISPFYMRWPRIMDFISLLNEEIKVHAKVTPEPHWYLCVLGVSPACQGQGIGGMLLQPVLERADRTKMPCYLETTTTSAVRFYERHGFEVVHQGVFADHQYWTMKRYPKG